MVYKIQIVEKLQKTIKKIPKKSRELIFRKIELLAHNPRPEDCKKLQGNRKPPLYRIRSGDFRIIYIIKDAQLLILVVDIGNRKDIYR